MQALDLLLNRRSQPRLQAPAPEGQVLENIKQAALRAPDHAGLCPWKFVVCQNQGLIRLGEVFQQAAIAANKSEKEIERAPQLPLRAPMVIVAIAKYTEHDKVPWGRTSRSSFMCCACYANGRRCPRFFRSVAYWQFCSRLNGQASV